MKLRPVLLIASVLALVTGACNLPVAPTGTVFPTPENASTAAVMTVEALQTQDALAQVTTVTPILTRTLAPSNTPGGPTITPTKPPCDQADFVADVTVPDMTQMLPNQQFVKTWRFRNSGSCAWNAGFAMTFISGDPMGAPASVNLPGDVPPGATVDLSISFTAPGKPGKYSGYWKFRNPAGVVFGVGADDPFYVIIQVAGPTPTVTLTGAASQTPSRTATITPTPTLSFSPTPTVTPAAEGVLYDFTAAMCKAEWRSEAGVLPCPGVMGDVKGAVLQPIDPTLETGDQEKTNPVLLTEPQIADGGAITGSYPSMTIQAGTHFRAALGCLQGATGCKVKYQLNYKEGKDGKVQNLGQWSQTYDGSIQTINVDLSSLAGKDVILVLVVLADGPGSDQNQAVWVYPRLSRG